jgi:hypothetical protein
LPGPQLVHADGPAPEQLRHDVSHGPQDASLVALHTANSYVPAVQVEQESHVVWPD